MNIAFFTATYKPTINGIVTHISSIKLELEKMGHTVTVIAPKYPGYQDSESNIIRYNSLPNPLVNTYPIPFPLIEFISKLAKYKFDIIHTHHPFQVGLLAKVVADDQGKPLIYTNHTQLDDYAEIYSPKIMGKVTKKLVQKLVKQFAHSCDVVISPSNLTKNKLINSFGINQVPIEVIPNGIEMDIFQPNNNASDKSKLNIPNESKVLTFVGRLDKCKNLKQLIKLIKTINVPDIYFLVIGDGELKSELMEMTSGYKNIKFTGQIAREQLSFYLNITDYFISLSESEVMPISYLEALASGVPIIAVDSLGTKEIVQHNQNGYLLKGDIKSMSRQLQNILDNHNPNEYTQKSRAARESVKKYHIEKVAEKLAELHTQVAQQ